MILVFYNGYSRAFDSIRAARAFAKLIKGGCCVPVIKRIA
jgi:hypothetical protein